MEQPADNASQAADALIQELVELERQFYFEKRNVKTERQRKVRELIERHTPVGDSTDDS